jgi:hypothetical protein
MYLNKLPEHFAEGARVLVADPMLATGDVYTHWSTKDTLCLFCTIVEEGLELCGHQNVKSEP